MSRNYNYEKLNHLRDVSTYVTTKQRPVPGLEDPYNPLSYNVYYANSCKKPNNQSYNILENYKKIEDEDYYLVEYKK